jgi:hypothetical protein
LRHMDNAHIQLVDISESREFLSTARSFSWHESCDRNIRRSFSWAETWLPSFHLPSSSELSFLLSIIRACDCSISMFWFHNMNPNFAILRSAVGKGLLWMRFQTPELHRSHCCSRIVVRRCTFDIWVRTGNSTFDCFGDEDTQIWFPPDASRK